MWDQDVITSFGSRGRFYPGVLNLTAFVAISDKDVEVTFILDDNGLTDHLCFIQSDGRRRTARLVCIDDSHNFFGCSLQIPANEIELPLQFYEKDGAIRHELRCLLNLSDGLFYPLTDHQANVLFTDPSGVRVGMVEEAGVNIRYAEKNYEDPMQKAMREAKKAGPVAKALGLLYELFGLVMRCYVGAWAAYNFKVFGPRSLDRCIMGAVALGFVSSRTLGSTIITFFKSKILWVLGILTPVLIIIMFALNPALYNELMADPSYFFGISNWRFRREFIIDGAKYATAGLAVLSLILGLLMGGEEEEGKKK